MPSALPGRRHPRRAGGSACSRRSRVWNRLEGRPRTPSFDRALRAEVRDALWMLTKQWQMGEFRGSDAGSPVFAKLQMDDDAADEVPAATTQAAELFDDDVPLEAKVERRPIAAHQRRRSTSLDLRLAMGRQWLALIAEHRRLPPGLHRRLPDRRARPDEARGRRPLRPSRGVAALRGASPAARWTAARSTSICRRARATTPTTASPASTPATTRRSTTAATRFLAWFERLLLQPPPSGDDAWIPPRLEYQFAASAPEPDGTEKVYVADEYYQGRLDWYSLDVDAGRRARRRSPAPTRPACRRDAPRTMIPVPVSFAGMPNTRWWAFEDGQTNFGDIDASTTDLAKLLFLEFALVYANDWFVDPVHAAGRGDRRRSAALVVTNVFGERFWIERGRQRRRRRLAALEHVHRRRRGEPAAQRPTPACCCCRRWRRSSEGAPDRGRRAGPRRGREHGLGDRDARSRWPSGDAKPRHRGGARRRWPSTRRSSPRGSAAAAAAPAASAPIRYQVMTTVPENWIPFIPVHVDGQQPRDPAPAGRPAAHPRRRSGPAGQGRSRAPCCCARASIARPPSPTSCTRRRSPRAGTRVLQAYQRTRWTDGRVYTWLRVRRQTGPRRGSERAGVRPTGRCSLERVLVRRARHGGTLIRP